LGKPEALTTSGRSEVQNYKPHDNRYLQPAGGGQLTPVKSGQGHGSSSNLGMHIKQSAVDK